MKSSVSRSLVTGFVALCGGTVATAALLLPVSAGAAPAAPGTPIAGAAHTPPSVEHATLDEALAAAGTNRAEFEARSDLAENLVQAQQDISTQFPGAVAGVQIVDGRGQVVVDSTCADAADACAAAAARGFEAVDPATAAADRASDPELAAGQQRPRVPLRPVQSLGSIGGGQQAPVPSPTPTPTPSHSPTPVPPPTPSPQVTPLMGGAEYYNPTIGAACSLGINATIDGAPANITAAHCSETNNPVQFVESQAVDPVTGKAFGDFVNTAMDINLDYAVIVGNAYGTPRLDNNLITGPTSTPLLITGWQKPVVGQIACKSGWRTGYTCGPVLGSAGALGVPIADAYNKTMFGLCAIHGDSGAAIFSGSKALGIVSVSNAASWESCAEAVTGLQAVGESPAAAGPNISAILAKQSGLAVGTG